MYYITIITDKIKNNSIPLFGNSTFLVNYKFKLKTFFLKIFPNSYILKTFLPNLCSKSSGSYRIKLKKILPNLCSISSGSHRIKLSSISVTNISAMQRQATLSGCYETERTKEVCLLIHVRRWGQYCYMISKYNIFKTGCQHLSNFILSSLLKLSLLIIFIVTIIILE